MSLDFNEGYKLGEKFAKENHQFKHSPKIMEAAEKLAKQKELYEEDVRKQKLLIENEKKIKEERYKIHSEESW